MPYDYTTNIPGYEVCYFRNICNEVIPYPKDGLDYLPIKIIIIIYQKMI